MRNGSEVQQPLVLPIVGLWWIGDGAPAMTAVAARRWTAGGFSTSARSRICASPVGAAAAAGRGRSMFG